MGTELIGVSNAFGAVIVQVSVAVAPARSRRPAGVRSGVAVQPADRLILAATLVAVVEPKFCTVAVRVVVPAGGMLASPAVRVRPTGCGLVVSASRRAGWTPAW